MGASKELNTIDRIVSPTIGCIQSHLVGCTMRVVSRDTWRHCLGFVPTCRSCPTSGPCNCPGGATPHLDRTLLVLHTTRPSLLATACIATSASYCQLLIGRPKQGPIHPCVAMAFAPYSSPALTPINRCTSRSNRRFTREMHAAGNRTPFATLFSRLAPPVQLQQQSSLCQNTNECLR